MSEIVVTDGERVVDEKRFNREVAVLGDTQVFQPAVVNRLEYDHENGMSQITRQNCGEVENRIESDKNPDLTVEGIVSESQKRFLKHIHRENRLTLVSELHHGPVKVKRATLEQNTDVIHISVDGRGDKQLAFPFQLQLTAPAKQGDPTTDGEEVDADPAEVIGTAPILHNRPYDRSAGSYDPD